MTVELPARLLADRLGWVLAAACAVALELTLARYPDALPGGGVLVGGLLLAWQRKRALCRPRAVVIDDRGVAVRVTDSGAPVSAAGPRARVLGRSVLLHWREPGRTGTAWLTPADLPRDVLRTLRVRMVTGPPAGGPRTGAGDPVAGR